MPKGYWIAHVDVTDADAYPEYVRLDTPVVAEHGGRFVVRGGAFTAPEGPVRTRHVVVEFDSYDAALACYRSDAYQAAATIRRAASDSDIVVVEGLSDDPAPTGGGFWVLHFDVEDPAALGAYADVAGPLLTGLGARYLVRMGRFEAPEAPQPAVHVIVAFDTAAAAQAAYAHPDYAPLIAQRRAATSGSMIIIEGAA